MALAVITQETFQGRGTYTASSPGNLGTVNPLGGSAPFVKLVGGPRLSSDSSANSLGWSADLQNTSGVTPPQHRMAIPSGNQNLFTFSWGCFCKSLATSGSNNCPWVVIEGNALGNNVFSTLINPSNGHLLYTVFATEYNTPTDTGVALPLRQWVEMRVTMQNQNPGTNSTYNILWQYRVYGTSTWITIANISNVVVYQYGMLPTAIIGGFGGGAGSYGRMNGRYAMPTLLSMGSWSDNSALLSALATPVVDCAATPSITWLWDPANFTSLAADTNDGVTAPYSSLSWITTLDTFCGFFSPPAGSAWQTATSGVPSGIAATIPANEVSCTDLYLSGAIALAGDTLQINNNSAAEIKLGNNALTLNSDGLSIVSSGGASAPANLCFAAEVAPSAWSVYSGNIYQASAASYNSSLATYGVLMCNRIPLTALTGSSVPGTFTTGSYWSNNTTIYVRTLTSASPAADGNCYEVCSGFDNSINGTHKLVRGINIIGTDDRDHTGTTQSGRSFLNTRQPNELAVFDTCQGRLWGKHFLANGANSDDSNSIFVGVFCKGSLGDGQCGAGGQSIFADNSTTGSGQRSAWFNCTDGGGNITQSGNPLPATATNQCAWLCHGAVYASITLTNCDFSHSGGMGVLSAAPVNVINCKLLAAAQGNGPGSTQTTFTRCTIANPANLVGVYCNCILTWPSGINIGAGGGVATNAILNSCTLDGSACSGPIFTRTGPITALALNECLLLTGGNTFITGALSGDVFTSSFCEIQAPPSGYVYLANWPGNATITLAQAQSLNIDAASMTTVAAAVEAFAGYIRTGQSTPANNVGPAQDMTGVTFKTRQTAGAYEFVPASGVGAGSVALTYGNFNANSVSLTYGNFN